MRVEFNSCRWLMFSNHLNAVPLDESDRRFEVVITKNKPRDEEYYSELYELLKNPAFISAVAQTLATRDITNFNPGARPEMSASKKLMIEESKSEAQKLADEIVKFWPYDVITLEDIYAYLKTTHGDKAVRPVCEQAGMQNISNPIRVFGDKRRCKILRNYEQWQSATTAELIEELEKRHPKLSAEEVVMRSIEKLQA